MANIKAGGYISQVTFNNGESIEIKQNDIVVLVGPNNAGKSQSLQDIYALSSNGKQPSIVIKNIKIQKSDVPIPEFLEHLAVKSDNQDTYGILESNVSVAKMFLQQYSSSEYFEHYRNLFVANLGTTNRLNICNPPQSVNRRAPKRHPIHFAAFHKEYRKWLSKNFKQAFGEEITPYILNGASIPLCVGPIISLDNIYEDEQERQEAYADVLATYKQVQNQGDGIKSFTGILLYLMLDYYCVFLIDEPESFLHPPQARIMGQIIGETLTTQQQAFISTHSEEFIKGLLEACPERVKIVRITREEDTNYLSILDNEKIKLVWNDPLLKYSNILSSLFHKTVVLCESESDCKMYSIIDGHLKRINNQYSETLFIHCGGKHHVAKIVTALKALNIEIKVICDIDVMDNKTIFKSITDALGIEWSKIEQFYTVTTNNLSLKEPIKRSVAKETITNILGQSENENLSNDEVQKILRALKPTSKWAQIKLGGIQTLPSGDSSSAFTNMNLILKSYGFYIVPVGELERFITEVGGHGSEWVNQVLQKYPDLNNTVYHKIKDFLLEMKL